MAATPVPIGLADSVPLAATDVTGALTAFFTIGPILGVLALIVALRLAPIVMSTLRQVVGRR